MSILKITIKEKARVIFSRKISRYPILFGRGDQNHISFPKTTFLSRTHGSIGLIDGVIVVTDLNSTNGIYVDGSKVANLKFKNKGKFEIGDYVFEVEKTEEEVKPKPILVPNDFTKVQAVAKTETIPKSDAVPKSASVQKVEGVPKVQSSNLNQAKIIPKIDDDISELTVISKRLVSVANKIKFEVEDNLKELRKDEIALQAVVTWGKDIFDVRQFQAYDFVIAGNSPFDPIQVPSLKGKIKLGKYLNNKGELSIPFGMKWRLNHQGHNLDAEQAVNNKLAQVGSKSVKFGLSLEDVCTIDLGHETALHLRYVEVPRPFIPKTWIENKEIFKKAITVSLGIHFLFSLISVFSAEKITAPQVENIPPRFAKLILDPPKMLLAPPPKIEIPIVEQKPPEPEIIPKPKPEIKPVVKTYPKTKPKPIVENKLKPRPSERVTTQPNNISNKPPAKNNSDEMADSFNNMFSEVADTSSNIANTPIKLDKSKPPGPMTKGVNMAGVAGAIKSQVGKLQSKEGTSQSVGQQVGNVGYQSGGGGSVGKRKVVSGVLGIPKLEAPSLPQGIKQDQVMAVVNKHLNDIHRCYDRALMDDSNLAGRVEYEWNITASGSVTSAIVKRSEMSNADGLNKCILAIFYKMKFPAAKNGQPTLANIGFPFGKL